MEREGRRGQQGWGITLLEASVLVALTLPAHAARNGRVARSGQPRTSLFGEASPAGQLLKACPSSDAESIYHKQRSEFRLQQSSPLALLLGLGLLCQDLAWDSQNPGQVMPAPSLGKATSNSYLTRAKAVAWSLGFWWASQGMASPGSAPAGWTDSWW